MNSSRSLRDMVFKADIFAEVLRRVNNATTITRAEVLSESRERAVIYARFAVYIAMRKLGYSTPVIGELMRRDHSTVCNGIARARGKYDNDPQFRALVDSLIA